MMTREQALALLETAGRDIDYSEQEDEISVEVYDFIGFDEDWSEIMREFDDEELVDEIYAKLEQEAISVEGDFYRYFDFGDFTICWGYASYNI